MRMDLNAFKCRILRESLMRRLLLKAFVFGSAMLVLSIIHMAHEVEKMQPPALNFEKCPLNFGSNPCYNVTEFSELSVLGFSLFGTYSNMPCIGSEDLTKNVFKELMWKNLLDANDKALCVGAGSTSALVAMQELGLSKTFSVNRHPFFSLLRRKFVYELDFADGYFDFVFSRALDRVSVPALLVLEIERVLRPGGIGAMLVGAPDLYSGSLVRSATPVSSFLKSCDIVHVCGVGSYTLVIFKKRFDEVAFFDNYELPKECPAITNNKRFMKFLEPLVDEKSAPLKREVSYLPKFMNVSSRNKLIYVNVGVEESTNLSVSELLMPYNSMGSRASSVYLIDHNTSVLSSHVTNPAITFIYHPGLAGENAAPEVDSDEYSSELDGYELLGAPQDDEEFDFIHWLKGTVVGDDFVVLRINARTVKYDILGDLFRTGAICMIDELFFRCSETVDCQDAICGDCMGLLKSLRNNGVFVHQWSGY